MATGKGLSVKERMLMLQGNNSSNPPLAGSVVSTPAASAKPKPQPPPIEAKPKVEILPNKPVTANKPAAVSKPPSVPLKPLAAKTAADVSDKPVDSAKAEPKPLSSPFSKGVASPYNKGVTSLSSKEMKSPPSKEVASPYNKGVASPYNKGVTSPSSKEITSPSSKEVTSPSSKEVTPNKGVASLVPKKPESFLSEKKTMDINSNLVGRKPDSVSPPASKTVQERLAALKRVSGSFQETAPLDNCNNSVSVKSPPASSRVFPKPFSKQPVNGPKVPGEELKMDSVPGIKPSDIIKSIHQAALEKNRQNDALNKTSEEKKKSIELFFRKSDKNKFRKLEVAAVISSESAPAKPLKIDNVDLTTFVKAYAAAKENKLNVDGANSDLSESVNGEVDELHVEAEGTSIAIRPRGSLKRATSVRVSRIPEYTEEEEEHELYTDGKSDQVESVPTDNFPEEVYDDCLSAADVKQPEPEDPEEIYEPLDEELEPEPQQPSPQSLPFDGQMKKEKEKFGKKKDKPKDEANKKEEKERKKREEEMRKLRNKFGLSDTDEKVGDGVVKNSASAGVFSKDLAVLKGEIISILRMDGNPAGKWLVQNEHGKIGFVSSNNIEIATPTIRQLMGAVKAEAENEELSGDDYEPLPGGEVDEIYEEM